MRSSIKLIAIILLACGAAAAQSSTAAKPADKSRFGGRRQSSLRSNGRRFYAQTFGYEPDVSWKISSIRPAPVPGLAEVNVILASSQGQQLSRFSLPQTANMP